MFLPLKALFFGVYIVDIFVSAFVNFVNLVVGSTCILIFVVRSFRWFNGFCNYIIPQKEELGTAFQVCARLFFFVGAATGIFNLLFLSR